MRQQIFQLANFHVSVTAQFKVINPFKFCEMEGRVCRHPVKVHAFRHITRTSLLQVLLQLLKSYSHISYLYALL